jgi:hypothetical protein
LIGKRDRVLVAVGMAGAFRRSELVALTTAGLGCEVSSRIGSQNRR